MMLKAVVLPMIMMMRAMRHVTTKVTYRIGEYTRAGAYAGEEALEG